MTRADDLARYNAGVQQARTAYLEHLQEIETREIAEADLLVATNERECARLLTVILGKEQPTSASVCRKCNEPVEDGSCYYCRSFLAKRERRRDER